MCSLAEYLIFLKKGSVIQDVDFYENMLDKKLCLKQDIFEVTITIRKSPNSKNIAA